MTSTTNEESLILKTDVLGRVRMPKERREAILDEFERSGMSGQAFAAQIGVKYTTFAGWVQRRKRKRGKYPAKTPQIEQAPIRLFEAVVEPQSEASPGCLEVKTSHGLKLSIRTKAEAGLAAELLRCLKGGGSC
ncbi:MAG: hypothetical protein JJT75_15155 [Opitutales bacterium]|nr:hypothetical protein [Opitutales bacterium]